MNSIEKVSVLIGSPKGEASSSAALGNYLLSGLEKIGLSVEKSFVYNLIYREKKREELISLFNNSDLIVLTYPLYVDCLPALIIEMMELVSKSRTKLPSNMLNRFAAISNSGFPEAKHSDISVEMCRLFAKKANLKWLGGLTLGGGPFLQRGALEKRSKLVRNVIDGLDMAVAALSEGQEIPKESKELISKQIITPKFYRMMGNLGWRLQARSHKKLRHIKDKPDLEKF